MFLLKLKSLIATYLYNVRNIITPLQVFSLMQKAKLNVATIMDEFSFTCYSFECNLLQLTPNNYLSELEKFIPDLLFIESAACGKDSLWSDKIKFRRSFEELDGIVQWCKKRHIPTVFWNKEDPIEFDVFIRVAKIFDFIFTVDANCIQKYKKLLKHDRVYLLPFAVQPLMYNPIEKFIRQDACCFTGSYYRHFKDRSRNFHLFIDVLKKYSKIDIYDRYDGCGLSNYSFPVDYHNFIIGALPFKQMPDIYKKYKYAINMNTVKDSPTMMSRRVFELIASNILVFSNYSDSIKIFFGDLIVATDDKCILEDKFIQLSVDKKLQEKIKLYALRKVMNEHTYEDRFNYIVKNVFNRNYIKPKEFILMISFVKSGAELKDVICNFTRQSYQIKQLLVICNFANFNEVYKDYDNICFLSGHESREIQFSQYIHANFIGLISPNSYYGKFYLEDMCLATKYTFNLDAITKSSKFSYGGDKLIYLDSDAYSFGKVANLEKSIIKRELLNDLTINDLLSYHSYKNGNIFKVDGYNYCPNINGIILSQEQLDEIDGRLDCDTGNSISSIYNIII